MAFRVDVHMVCKVLPVVLMDILGSSITLVIEGARPKDRLLRECPPHCQVTGSPGEILVTGGLGEGP